MLYHCSFETVKRFVPRIPTFRAPGENGSIKRICLSESIEQAVTAMSEGGNALLGMLLCKEIFPPILHIYECKRGKKFIPPEKLEEKSLVGDASATREWWALESPHFHHRILQIDSADTVEKTDVFGRKVIAVLKIKFQELTDMPALTPESFLEKCLPDIKKKYGVRKILADVWNTRKEIAYGKEKI